MLLSDPVLQELNWRLVAEGRMLPFPVVEDFDVLEAAYALPVLDALDCQFLELGRVCLLRYLHFLPSKSDANFRSPLADEISGEAQSSAFNSEAETR
jgi:hypothetical protein